VLIKIVLDKQGSIIDHSIYNSSGNKKLDEAVNHAIKETRMISEPPPAGMPRTLKLRISISG
jgi:TonB family protein